MLITFLSVEVHFIGIIKRIKELMTRMAKMQVNIMGLVLDTPVNMINMSNNTKITIISSIQMSITTMSGY